MKAWNKDWHQFCEDIVNDFNEGLDDAALSRKYGGYTVRWSGTVTDLNLESQSLLSVGIAMDVREKYISKGYKFNCNAITLFIDDALKSTWNSVDIGEIVDFEALIYVKNGPFHGVRISTFPGDDSAILLLGLHRAKKVA